ncbi:MAG: hypothetical protein ACYTEL_26230 [Planctomycetota bacterium]|jgi:uncharacterized membrane-anchored protein YhcB (DUF1043 family)
MMSQIAVFKVVLALVVVGVTALFLFKCLARGSKRRQQINEELNRLSNELEQFSKQADQAKDDTEPRP